MALQTPLAKVRHLGSAKEGVNHWWWQRLTAILLVPLSLWFVGSLWSIVAGGADRDAFADWLSGPVAAVLMLLFLGATFYHLKLGLQVVIEDYVHGKLQMGAADPQHVAVPPARPHRALFRDRDRGGRVSA